MSQQPLKSNKVSFDLSNNTTIEFNKDQEINDKRSRYIPFWSVDPNILFQQKYIFEFFPVENMTYEQKLNAVTRSVIILTIIGFVLSRTVRTLLIGLVTIGAIYILHYYHEKEKTKTESKKIVDNIKEGFDSPAIAFLKENNIPISDEVFDKPTSHNPFDNVLMTDYDYNPNKKPAPPAFNKNVNDQILSSAKQLVQDANPDQPDIADKLFNSIGDNLVFEQSLRQFNSNPSTTIPNDSNAFAQFCYGSAISSKEGNPFSLARNLSHYTLY
jgi:signal peptidase I